MTNKTKHKKISTGGVVYATPFRAGGGVSIVGSVAGGYVAAQSEELAQVHAQMLMEGTLKRSKKDIQLALDSWGASLAFAASGQRLRFVAQVPAKYANQLLELIAEILREPAFPKEELAILKVREEAALAMEAQDTREQARIALTRLVYPKGHPAWSESTEESKKILTKLTQQALQKFHTSAHGGRTLVVSCAGDLAPQKAFSLVEKHFVTLPKGKETPVRVTAVQPKKAQTKLVGIPHKASIDYMVGLPVGITDTHKDYPALVLGLQVLGNPGGFTGRLMKVVREEEGLTYGVYAYPQGFAHNVDGLAYVWGTFAPQLFAKGQASIKREIKNIVERGVGEEELRKHAELFAARTVVRFSNSSSIAAIVHDTVVNKKPLSYITDLPKKMLALKASEVNKVLKKYLLLTKLSEAAAGPVGNIDNQ